MSGRWRPSWVKAASSCPSASVSPPAYWGVGGEGVMAAPPGACRGFSEGQQCLSHGRCSGSREVLGLRLESWVGLRAGLRAGPDQGSVTMSILWASASGAHLGHGAPPFPFPKGSSSSRAAPRSPPGLRLQLSFSGPGAAPAPCWGSRWRVRARWEEGGVRGQRPRPCASPSSAGASSPGPALFVCPGVRDGLWLYLGGRCGSHYQPGRPLVTATPPT